MKTYIFAIGGTGARVLRSLTMLLAAGVRGTSTTKEIVPIVIDYDGDNGDTKRSQDIMDKYREIYRESYDKKINDHEEHFFCSPIRSLYEIIDDETVLSSAARFRLPLENMDRDTTFSGYIDYEALKQANGTLSTRRLLESLYSNEKPEKDGKENLKAELHMKLYHGFRGCPNIGCIVTRQLIDNNALKQLPGLIQDGDRVFIVGSIFGGTGASGIPMLLDFFKKGDYKDTFQNIPVGVLAVTPYFNLTRVDASDSPIDSNTFIAKTKAALKAYETTVYQLADAVYMVGDNKIGNQFNNIEGGENQENNAHIVEVVGAMMALHFSNNDSIDPNNKFFEFGLKNNPENNISLKYSDFYEEETSKPYFDPLARFFILRHFFNNFMSDVNKWKESDYWTSDAKDEHKKVGGLRERGEFRKHLGEFFEYFNTWLKELANMDYRPFELFNLDESSYGKLLKYKDLELSEDKVREYLSTSADAIKEEYSKNPIELFFVAAYNAFDRVIPRS